MRVGEVRPALVDFGDGVAKRFQRIAKIHYRVREQAPLSNKHFKRVEKRRPLLRRAPADAKNALPERPYCGSETPGRRDTA